MKYYQLLLLGIFIAKIDNANAINLYGRGIHMTDDAQSGLDNDLDSLMDKYDDNEKKTEEKKTSKKTPSSS